MDYQIAIPSYDRSEICQSKTLAMLEAMGVDADRVTVFVADESQREIYNSRFRGGWRVVAAELGIFKARRFYHAYYPEGTRILNLDDDIERCLVKQGSKATGYPGTIDDLAADGFSQCEAAGAKLWGVYPVNNGFFMKDYTVLGLRYVVGAFYGSFAGDHVFLGPRSQQSSGEDYETTLRSFKAYGKIVRLEYLTFKTKYFAEGGIDSELKSYGIMERGGDHARALTDIASRHSHLATIYKKAGGMTNIRLKNVTMAKIPR
jgi:hypothetical protein